MEKSVTSKEITCGKHGNKVFENMGQVSFVDEKAVGYVLNKIILDL